MGGKNVDLLCVFYRFFFSPITAVNRILDVFCRLRLTLASWTCERAVNTEQI